MIKKKPIFVNHKAHQMMLRGPPVPPSDRCFGQRGPKLSDSCLLMPLFKQNRATSELSVVLPLPRENRRKIALSDSPPTNPGPVWYLCLWGTWLTGQTSCKSTEQMVLLQDEEPFVWCLVVRSVAGTFVGGPRTPLES